MVKCLKKIHGNASSLHTTGHAARVIVEHARKSVAALLDCQPEQIIFTSGGTEANITVIKGVFAAAGRGHIITTKIEHESVLGACSQVEAQGAKVTYLSAGTDGYVRAEHVRSALQPDTILISVMHANNETGVIQPVQEITRVASEAGVPFHTDAVQTVGKIETYVDNIGCEFLSLTAHKINGPKGVGALYWRGSAKWLPLSFGGSQEREMRAGTEGVHQIAGLGAAVELASSRMVKEYDRLTKLREFTIHGLHREFPAVRINDGPKDCQLPGTINATFPGKNGLWMLAGLDCYKVAVSIGSACTADHMEPSHVLLGMGIPEEDALSTIRISMGSTTYQKDIKYFLRALGQVLKGDPQGLAFLDPQRLTEERIRSEKTFIIDLRLPFERLLSPCIPGAKLWSHIGFERYFKKIPWDREVILMCTTGIFASAAGYRLAKVGHSSVRVVNGGYSAWNAVYPDLINRLKSHSSAK
jgi:cysteine desulfurase